MAHDGDTMHSFTEYPQNVSQIYEPLFPVAILAQVQSTIHFGHEIEAGRTITYIGKY